MQPACSTAWDGETAAVGPCCIGHKLLLDKAVCVLAAQMAVRRAYAADELAIGLLEGKGPWLAPSPQLLHNQPQSQGSQCTPTGEAILVEDELHEQGSQQHHSSALDFVVPELCEGAQVGCKEACQDPEDDAERAVHDAPDLVAGRGDSNVDEDGVACDGYHVVEAGSGNHCGWDACTATSLAGARTLPSQQ